MKKQIKTIVKQVAAAATRLKNQYGETPQQEYARIMKGVAKRGL